MKRNIFITGLLCLLIIWGDIAIARQAAQTSDTRECIRNFTYEGSYWSGRTFRTHAFVQNVSRSVAVERAARYIASAGGWQLNTINKEIGVISASQTVGHGRGKTNPLNVTIESVKGGVNVLLSFSCTSGEAVRGHILQNTFCSIIEAIGK
jgi:hypothetical protein